MSQNFLKVKDKLAQAGYLVSKTAHSYKCACCDATVTDYIATNGPITIELDDFYQVCSLLAEKQEPKTFNSIDLALDFASKLLQTSST